jgi:hypothetical protein
LKATPAALTRVIDISGIRDWSQPMIIARNIGPLADGLRAQGFNWFRITCPAHEPTRVYMEAWREKPAREGRLNRRAALRVFPPPYRPRKPRRS